MPSSKDIFLKLLFEKIVLIYFANRELHTSLTSLRMCFFVANFNCLLERDRTIYFVEYIVQCCSL